MLSRCYHCRPPPVLRIRSRVAVVHFGGGITLACGWEISCEPSKPRIGHVSWNVSHVPVAATITLLSWYLCSTASSVAFATVQYGDDCLVSEQFVSEHSRYLLPFTSFERSGHSVNDIVWTIKCCRSISIDWKDSSVFRRHEERQSDKGTAASLDARILKAAPGGQPDAMRRRCWRKRAWMRLTLSTWVSF